MNEKKNIDRLFQEKFKDFEIAPSDAVWNRINDSLPNKKKKRRVIALWWQIGGVAAVIALLLTVGVSVFDSSTNPKDDPTVVSTEDKNTNKDNSTSDKQNELNNENGVEKLELVNSDKNNESIENLKEDKTPIKENKSKNLTANPKPQINSAVVYSSKDKDKEENSVSEESKKLNAIINNSTSTTEVAANNKNSENSNQTELVKDAEIKSAIKKSIENNETAVTENSTSNNSENSNTKNSDSNSIDELTKEKDAIIKEGLNKESIESAIAAQDNNIEKEDQQSRWSIAPNVAPVYYSSLGQGSSIDSQFNQNSKNSDINMSYGIAASYALSKKFKVRAGINRVNLSQTTSNVFAFSGNEFASRNGNNSSSNINGNINISGNNVLLMSAEMFDRSTTPELFNTKIAGNVDQRFGFIEIPLELEYRLLDKKFGLNVIGGFSTFFLNSNEVYADIDGVSTFIGETSSINSTSFSANFGLGFDYNLSKQWNINLEPQFKYQLNTFNNTYGNYRPFFIGVYTGLSFKF